MSGQNVNPAYSGRNLRLENRQICTRCIFDDSLHNIDFDEAGVCNYCRMIDGLKDQFKTGTNEGNARFAKIVDEIKEAGRGKPYDVAIGVSGGTDSSYMLHIAKEMGLRPLAVHYDNTWNSAIATLNIHKVTKALDVDLYTHVCDNKESDDIFKSFFKASVPEIDGPTDIALVEVMYRAASKYDIGYVFEGHSFIAEGVAPMGRAYVDGGYIADIRRRFGTVKPHSFPNMPFLRFLYWTCFRQIRKIRPFWYIEYNKEDARELLTREYGWTYYGGHHLENRMTAFHHSYYTPTKFGLDQRNNTLAASVREGRMNRDEAIAEYAKPPHIEDGLVEYFKKRMRFSDAEFDEIMARPPRYYTDYRTYKKRFEHLRSLFYILAKAELVPMSFYLKYCFPAADPREVSSA